MENKIKKFVRLVKGLFKTRYINLQRIDTLNKNGVTPVFIFNPSFKFRNGVFQPLPVPCRDY